MRALLFLSLLAPAALLVRAEPIAPEAASAALREAHAPPPPGSYRQQGVRKTKNATVTTTTLTLRQAGAPVLIRTEAVRTVEGHPERTRTAITITNADGRWQLYDRKALLMPAPFQAAKIIESLNDGSLESPAKEQKNATSTSGSLRTLAQHIHVSGESFTEAGQPLLRITRTYDKEARELLQKLMDQQVAELKKQLPFGKRMLISTALALKGGLGSFIPAREVIVIDPASHRVRSTETYSADGKILGKRGEATPPERIDDLPPTTFAIPADFELVRPKNLGEAMELAEKLEKKQRAADSGDTAAD